MTLGPSFIGHPGYCQRAAKVLLDRHLNGVPSLQKLPVRSAMLILRGCINCRPGYLARATERTHTGGPLQEFDRAVDKAIRDMLDAGDDEFAVNVVRSVRVLPEVCGGLNMPKHSAGPASDKGVILSRFLCSDSLPDHLVDQTATDWPKTKMETFIDERDPELPVDINPKKFYKTVSLEMYQVQLQIVLNALTNANKHLEKRWLQASCFHNSARWIHWNGGVRQRFNFTNTQYKIASRMKLLLPLLSPGDEDLVCPCKAANPIHLCDDPYHFLSCELLRGQQTKRHTTVCSILADFAAGFCSGGGEVVKEPPIPFGQTKRPDIRMRKAGGLTQFLDVAITNPCSATNMAHANAATTGNAALLNENRKRLEYVGLHNFTPFVLEATGYMGAAALQFADKIRNLDRNSKPFYKHAFYAEMLASIAIANAEMCLLGYRQAFVAS